MQRRVLHVLGKRLNTGATGRPRGGDALVLAIPAAMRTTEGGCPFTDPAWIYDVKYGPLAVNGARRRWPAHRAAHEASSACRTGLADAAGPPAPTRSPSALSICGQQGG